MSATPQTFSGKVFQGVAWVSAGAFAVRVIGFLVSFYLLHTFSLRDYGTYQLVLAAGSLLALVMLQGVDEVIIAAGAKAVGEGDEGKVRDLMRGYLSFKLATGLLAWGFVMFASGLLARWYSADILGLLRTYAWVFLAIPFERTVLFHLSVHRRFATMGVYSFVQELLKGAFIVALVHYAHLGVPGILYAMIAALAVTAALFSVGPVSALLRGLGTASASPFLGLLRTQGVWVIGQRFIRQGEKNLRPFIIQALLGREAVALFSFAEKIYGYVAGTFPIDDVLMPTIASEMGDKERLQRILERGIKYTVPFYAFLALGVAAVSPFVVRAYFPQYLVGIPVLSAVLCYLPFIGIAYILSAFYVAHQQQADVFWVMCVRFAFFAAFLPISIRLFGPVGMGIEFTVTLLVDDLLRYLVLLRKHPHLKVQWGHVFRYDSYDRAVLARIWGKVTRRAV